MADMHGAKELVRAFLLQVRSGAHPEYADRFLAARVLAHQVQAENPVIVERSPHDYAEHVRQMTDLYGDFTIEIEELIAEGDRVYARWSQHGRHDGTVDGRPPTGAPLTQLTSAVYRVADGRITEYWIQIDRAGLDAQLHSGGANDNQP
jgi:predicted ester cyclase